jgi:hypothetical protein
MSSDEVQAATRTSKQVSLGLGELSVQAHCEEDWRVGLFGLVHQYRDAQVALTPSCRASVWRGGSLILRTLA